jgi:hypothetical protein
LRKWNGFQKTTIILTHLIFGKVGLQKTTIILTHLILGKVGLDKSEEDFRVQLRNLLI